MIKSSPKEVFYTYSDIATHLSTTPNSVERWINRHRKFIEDFVYTLFVDGDFEPIVSDSGLCMMTGLLSSKDIEVVSKKSELRCRIIDYDAVAGSYV